MQASENLHRLGRRGQAQRTLATCQVTHRFLTSPLLQRGRSVRAKTGPGIVPSAMSLVPLAVIEASLTLAGAGLDYPTLAECHAHSVRRIADC